MPVRPGFGLLVAAPGVGAFIGAFFSGWVTAVTRVGRAIVLAVIAWGLAILAFGLCTFSLPLALVMLAVAGAADVFSAVFRSTLVQTETPDQLRGRVTSIHTLVVTSGPRLGDIEAALVAAVIGPQLAVISGGDPVRGRRRGHRPPLPGAGQLHAPDHPERATDRRRRGRRAPDRLVDWAHDCGSDRAAGAAIGSSIIGGGFAGLYAAKQLRRRPRGRGHARRPAQLPPVPADALPGRDRRAVARRDRPAAALDPAQAAQHDGHPRRGGRASTPSGARSCCRTAARSPYDTLIVATGAHHTYFGHDDWAPIAPGLKTIEDATEIRRRILIAFEAAEREADPDAPRRVDDVRARRRRPDRRRAGRLARRDRARHAQARLPRRSIRPTPGSSLVEAMDRVLPPYPPGRSASAQAPARAARRRGPDRTTRVIDIDERERARRRAASGRGARRRSRRGPCCGRAGVQASSFARTVADGDRRRDRPERAGPRRARPDRPRPPRDLRRRRRGRAAVEARTGRRPASPRAAIQGGTYAAKVIRRRILGRPHEPFRYCNHGDVAVIGRLSGVTDIPWMGPFGQQGGFTAWLLWLGIHIAYLIGFANRIVVLVRWAWTFLTHGRGTRLITGRPLLPPIEEPEPPVIGAAMDELDGTRRRSRAASKRVPRLALGSAPRQLDPERGAVRAGRARRRSVPPFAARSSRAIVSPRPLPVGGRSPGRRRARGLRGRSARRRAGRRPARSRTSSVTRIATTAPPPARVDGRDTTTPPSGLWRIAFADHVAQDPREVARVDHDDRRRPGTSTRGARPRSRRSPSSSRSSSWIAAPRSTRSAGPGAARPRRSRGR